MNKNEQTEAASAMLDPVVTASAVSAAQPWRILVVDDDSDVHATTALGLRGVMIQERGLQLLHAYSAAEALETLEREQEVAVILLDVVMESENAGLATVDTIRNKLRLENVRIILRTGQPGQAPEIESILRYDINDYKTKSELTRNKLVTTVIAAIRSYEQLRRLDASRHGLEKIVQASNQFIAAPGLQTFAEGVITQIASLIGLDPEGLVCACSDTSKSSGQISDYLVIAAAGHLAHLIHHKVSEIEDAVIMSSLTTCLSERRHVISEKSITLFFPGREGGDFAAYVNAAAPLRVVDMHLLEVFCTNIALCADNIELVTRLRHQAYLDQLLGLPNRAAFLQHLEDCRKSGIHERQIIAILDIDQFTELNDMFGHAYGDQLLRAIAQRLSSLDLNGGMLARVAGDAFAIHVDEDKVSPNTLRQMFEQAFDVAGIQRHISVGMGFVRCCDVEGDNQDILKNASISLKQAKAAGQGQSKFYTKEMGQLTRIRTRLLHELHLAFDQDRLFLAYQPQVSLMTDRVIGVEALLRWRCDKGDLVSPAEFIPVAEQSGLIVPIGAWVLRTALAELKKLHAAGYSELRIAVNVSAVQFAEPDILTIIDEALHANGIAPHHLELEITESIAVMGMDAILKILYQIKERGIAVAIDDFGTGFSSLSYIDRLPADRLKIDRTFVTSLDAGEAGSRIAEMIVPLGHHMDMQVIAEGVENDFQAEKLRSLGCDEAQGFLYGKPMTSDELISWLGSRQVSKA